jgi:hypothetical protein
MIEKVVYSHWSKPMGEGKGKYVGFNTEQDMIFFAALSVSLSRKWFKEVELVTDTYGKELFVDKWKLPFTSVVVALDELEHIDKTHWAIGKLKACSIQTKPFMHQDMDVFWFKKPPGFVLNADAAFQNPEMHEVIHSVYKPFILHARKHFKKPKPFISYDQIRAVNCGIMAFNEASLPIFKDLYEHALEYIEYYDSSGDDMPNRNWNLSSLVFEQVHIYWFLFNAGIDIVYLSNDDDYQWVTEDRAKELGYTHTISNSKRLPSTLKKVMKKLSLINPELFKDVLLSKK